MLSFLDGKAEARDAVIEHGAPHQKTTVVAKRPVGEGSRPMIFAYEAVLKAEGRRLRFGL